MLRASSLLPILLALAACRQAHCQALHYGPASSCPDFHGYTQRHWQIQLGHLPARWIVTEDNDGLADRLVNAVSVFLIALITQRALCILPAQSQPPLEVAYDGPFIDWACRQGDIHANHTSKTHIYPWDHEPHQAMVNTKNWGDLTRVNSQYYQTFITGNLRQLGHNATVLKILLQRGLTVGLFSNPHHAEELVQLGLRPETAFGCIAAYLLRPRRDTLWLVPKPVLSVMTSPRIIKIGIQVRCGDAYIKQQLQQNATHDEMNDHDFDRLAKPYFDCAQALEQDIVQSSGGAVQVRWYLMTDTLAVRHTAMRRYGTKLITFNMTAIEFYQAVTDVGFQLTVMEHWLLQQAHYHIITDRSGLGRTAAFASLRSNNVYTMVVANRNSPDSKAQRVNGAGCLLSNHDRLRDVYNVWSGV